MISFIRHSPKGGGGQTTSKGGGGQTSRTKTWTTLIAHDIEYVNRRLSKAAYFFVDIKKEGICLYTSGNHRLARLREPDPRERLAGARADFTDWMDNFDLYG